MDRYSLRLEGRQVTQMMHAWQTYNYCCEVNIRRAKEQGFFCVQIDVKPSEFETIRFIRDIVSTTQCLVKKQQI